MTEATRTAAATMIRITKSPSLPFGALTLLSAPKEAAPGVGVTETASGSSPV